VQQGDNVLDIGCGWGGMLEYCVSARLVNSIQGITLSNAQYDYINQNKKPKISADLCSWANFSGESTFDSIVSIGAMEHFSSIEDRRLGKHIEVYRYFFQRCADLSKKNSYLGLQTIVTMKNPNTLQSMKDTHYLLTHVFPGSALPEIKDLQIAMHNLYEPVELRTIGLDYARTLLEWKKRLTNHKEIILNKYGEKLWLHYHRYFDAAIRGFKNGYTSLLQVSLRKLA
jgi:cyclopropane-fatty-acyl-phospholipid synthase